MIEMSENNESYKELTHKTQFFFRAKNKRIDNDLLIYLNLGKIL